jgi:hypothetical protein
MGAKWEQYGSLPPTLSTSELLMTLSRYKSVRRVLTTTLLFAGFNLGAGDDLCAQEAPKEETQSAEESADLSTPSPSKNRVIAETIGATSMGVVGEDYCTA